MRHGERVRGAVVVGAGDLGRGDPHRALGRDVRGWPGPGAGRRARGGAGVAVARRARSAGSAGPARGRRRRRAAGPRPSWKWHDEHDWALKSGPSPSRPSVEAGAVTQFSLKKLLPTAKCGAAGRRGRAPAGRRRRAGASTVASPPWRPSSRRVGRRGRRRPRHGVVRRRCRARADAARERRATARGVAAPQRHADSPARPPQDGQISRLICSRGAGQLGDGVALGLEALDELEHLAGPSRRRRPG